MRRGDCRRGPPGSTLCSVSITTVTRWRRYAIDQRVWMLAVASGVDSRTAARINPAERMRRVEDNVTYSLSCSRGSARVSAVS